MTKIGGDEEFEVLIQHLDGPRVPRGLGPEHAVPRTSLYTHGICEVCGQPLCEGTHAGKPNRESDVDPPEDLPLPAFLRNPLPDLRVVTPEKPRIGFGFGKLRDGAIDAQLRTLNKLRRMNAEASAWPRNLIVAPARLGLGLMLLASARLLTKAFADGVRAALRRGGRI